tara:strand:- start:160 stop:513 length:354 start_codon:yes stop_codon:yes gene_type:complete
VVSRIFTQGCPKCGGALKEDAREKEFSCMNCGMLFLPKTLPEVPLSKFRLMEPRLPGEKVESTEKPTLDTLNQEPVLDPEDLGDDSEWERLNPQLKLVDKKLPIKRRARLPTYRKGK